MSYQSINSVEAEQLLANNEAVLVDVREPAEHRQANITKAHLKPLSNLNLDGIDTTNKKVIIHCQKGMRGQKACQTLVEQHPDTTFYNLEGGIIAREDAGMAINKTNSAFLPLDRQVQLTIGTGVLTGVILSQTIDPNFIWLSGFFGAGMMMAGITGFCGLGRLMAIMPWNK
jgi:rhodanese-related sulfurtransferase